MITNEIYSKYCLESSQSLKVHRHRLLFPNADMSIQERIKATIMFLKTLNINVKEKVIERLRYLWTLKLEEEDKVIEVKMDICKVEVIITTTEIGYSIKKVSEGVVG